MKRQRVAVASIVLAAATLVGLATHEGYRDKAYIPVPGDRPTIDFGRTFNKDGSPVKMGDTSDPVRGLVALLETAEGHAAAVRKCLGPEAKLFPHEFQSFVKLSYNIGDNAFCTSSIPKKVKAEQYDAACETIKQFVCGPATMTTRALPGQRCFSLRKPMRVLKGLENRRAEEYAMCKGQA